jgi:hypothetical protein
MKDKIVKYVDSVLGEEHALTAAAAGCSDQVITVVPLSAKKQVVTKEVLAAPVSR